MSEAQALGFGLSAVGTATTSATEAVAVPTAYSPQPTASNEEFLLIETVPSGLSASGEGNPAPVRPRVIGLAYGGGKISLPGWKHPVVVDLAGLTLPESVPLLANHENRTAARIGVVSARVVRDAL
ncbi:MAG: hypothetical protein FWG74_08975, partial [Planctomycetes bacterium]|nr:hypothetical protein [Planctomycetota bacterium]